MFAVNVTTAFLIARAAVPPMLAGGSLDAFVHVSPPGQQGQAMEIANAALFLAGSEAAFVNGQEIVVDGGQIQQAPGGSTK